MMHNHLTYQTILAMALLAGYGCKKAYTPHLANENLNMLVVEGIINAGDDSTFITLSRTVKVADGRGINPEIGAQVTIEDEDGVLYTLAEKGNGVYAAPALHVYTARKHRLNIKTGDGEYQSDFVETKITPQVDKVDFSVNGDKVYVNVNTTDPTNSTRYYRWEYEETWEFNANFRSEFIKYRNDTILHNRVQDVNEIYHCWANQKTRGITLGSSAKLSQDVIKDFPILSIPGTSEKLGIKYSILVKQYALTKEAFEFWQKLKKNTEQLGTIFDPQPSQVKGNIYCITNPKEKVIGYVSTSTITNKRGYIDKSKLRQFITKQYYPDCKEDSVSTNAFLLYFIDEKGPYIPLREFKKPEYSGYIYSLPKCADCTLRGTTKKPDFWE